MNAHDDFMAAYERYKEQLRNVILANKATVFDALCAAKITSVEVEFDGEGDSGQIGEVTAYQDLSVVTLPSTLLTLRQCHFGAAEPSTAQEPLRDAIDTLCFDALEQEHDGWEINDGAYGTFIFDVPNRTIALEFHGRFIDVATSHHAF
jgi:hypothetical protein